MNALVEKALHQEIMLRLKRYPVIAISVPNSIYFPARTDVERKIIRRVISQMKSSGQLIPGAPDMVIAGARGAICAELKRPATFDLICKRPAGRLSKEQFQFSNRCRDVGVQYVVAYEWADIETAIQGLC